MARQMSDIETVATAVLERATVYHMGLSAWVRRVIADADYAEFPASDIRELNRDADELTDIDPSMLALCNQLDRAVLILAGEVVSHRQRENTAELIHQIAMYPVRVNDAHDATH